MALTGLQDTDRLVLLSLPYRDLLKACATNLALRFYCQDDNFWRDKVTKDFGEVVNYKPADRTYQQQYQDLNQLIETKILRWISALQNKRTDLIIMMIRLGLLDRVSSDDIAYTAATYGLLPALQELSRHGVIPGEAAVDEAAAQGHLQILKWMAQTFGLLPSRDGVDQAAANGHLPVLEWAAERRILPTTYGANGAALENFVPVLDFLARHGIFPNEEGAVLARLYESQAAVDWMNQQGIYPSNLFTPR